MKKTFLKLLFVFFLIVTSTVQSQNLTISSSGETGALGTNWSLSGNILTVTGTANIAASVIENKLASNSLSIEGNTTSFAVSISQNITSSASGNGLTIGATNNTGNISLNNAISLAGSVTIFGGRVNITDTFSLSSSNNLYITSINTVIVGTTTVGGSATINASGNFILGTNIISGTEFPITATGGFTKTGSGTSYLFSSINTTNSAVTIAGPVVVGNFNTSNAVTQINSNGGNISIPGAVSAYSGTGRDYQALVYANLYDAEGGSVTGSATDIYLRFNAGAQTFVGLPGMSSPYDLQYLVVAGGGGGGTGWGGYYSGGGGGGGGVADGTYSFTGSPLAISVGTGGGLSSSGNDSYLENIKSGGGGPGGNYNSTGGFVGTGGFGYTAGGGGGGAGSNAGNGASGGTGTQRNGGMGAGCCSLTNYGGSGGGAVGNGSGYTIGGAGYSSSITGVAVSYGAGAACSGTPIANTGGGGGSQAYGTYPGAAGAVILRFALPDASTLDAASLSTAFHLNALTGSVTLGSTVANLSNIEVTAGAASSITGPVTGTSSLLKTGTGALTLSGYNRYTGGTTVTTGTIILNDNNSNVGLGVIVGTLNINQNGTVQLTGNPSALGWSTDRVTTININGGVLESSTGQQHIWNLTGGLNFNGGGTLRTNGGTSNAAATSYFEWGVLNITITNPTSPAEIAGRIHLRNDLGTSVFTVADGAAENDLLISAAITQSNGSGLTKSGAGKLTFTGINSYSGATTISAGTLQIGSGGTLGTISAAGVTNNAALVFNRSDAFTISNVISGTGSVTKTGIGALTLSGANTYTGLTTISQGTLKCGSTTALGTIAGSTTIVTGAALDLNAITLGLAEPITVNGTGLSASGAIYNSTITAVTLPSPITLASDATINGATGNLTLSGTINGAFALNVNTINKTYTQSGIVGGTTPLTAYTVTAGNTGTATLSGATTVAGPVSISGGTLAVNANLSATANNVSLSAVTAVTQTAPITANGLDLNGAGTFTLTNTSNNIATLAGGTAASKTGTVNYIDSDGFTIGTVTNTGITTTGTITAETQLGNITIAQNITTDNTSTSAITINAGKPRSIGDAIGGNIIISGTPVITTGVNGITKLFSGREAESSGLSTFVGASNVRLGVDETTVTFAPVLANNNKYALYRYGDLTLGGITIVSSGGVVVNNGWEFVNNTIIPTSAAAINIDASVLQDYLLTNPLIIKAGSITFSTNITNATANQLTLNSNTFIKNTVATTITTQGGHVVMAANIDDATDGDTTTNGYIQFSSGLTMTTNGGNITLGGGDAAASGYALGTSAYPYEGLRVDGTLNINSGGGNIIMRGKSYGISTASGSWGMGFWNLTTGSITSGTGTITLDGFSQSYGGTHNSGIYTYGALTVTSTNTTADAIRLIGKSTGTSGESWGIEAESALSLIATGEGGGITMSSSQQNTASNQDIVLRGEVNILAKSGTINLLGGQSGGIANGNMWIGTNVYLGSKALSAVTSSSSNITIQYDMHAFTVYPKLATSGTVTWKPVSASFGQDVYTSWFNWNQNSQTMSGLTIGKSGNTANVIHQTTAITVAGPTTIYGGNIDVNQNLTSTLSGADILLQASGAVNLSANMAIQTNGGDVTLAAANGGIASGSSSAIYLYSSSQILTNGGNITLGGGYSGTEGNLYAATNIAGGGFAVRLLSATLTAAGGNIKIYGRNVSSYGDGVYLSAVNISTTGIGTIGIYGDSYGGFNNTFYFGGITFDYNASIIQTVNGNITLKGILTQSQSTQGYGINFYRYTGSPGQTRHIQILSQAGAIQITGDRGSSTGGGIGHSSWGNVYFGSPADNSFTASGDVVLTYSGLVNAGNNGFKVKTTGAVTYEPVGSSFIADQTLPASSNYILADGASSLTIGKAGNTANLTMNSAQTVAGPISIYAGTITLNANLTTTNNGAISLYSDNAIAGLSAQRNVTAAGAFNYIPQSNSFAAAVTYPITNLNVSSAGLLIGKPTNTAAITFGNATTIAGPITAYGGTVTLNANLTTTNNGNISLYSDNPLGGLSTARTLTAAGAFKFIPRTTTFTADVTYPITNLTATSTGLTIGNSTNDKNITISQDVIGGAGIELYGNNLNINANLKTTSSANMYLRGTTTVASDKYIESNGNFTHDGNLTFKSDANGTATFGSLGGAFTTVSGTATVERYIPTKRAYRFLSPSVTTTSSIKENWQENGDSTAGLGTHITGTGGATNGFDTTATNNFSMFTYNNGAWSAVTNTNVNVLTAGTPYRIMVRGDRTTDLTTNTPIATATVLRATGDLKTGNYTPTLNQLADGYSFVGNPYQAPIDIKAVLTASTNMNTDVLYYWDPTLNARGAYVTRTLGIVNQNSVTSSFNQYLQPGQAVFVKKDNTANMPTMTITENHKSIINAAPGVFRNASSNEIGVLRANLKASVNNQWTTVEGALAIFHSDYSWGATQEDATKLSNLDEEVSFIQKNTSLAIAMQNNPASTDELPIKLNNTRYANYQWQFELTNYDGLIPYLFDNSNNSYTKIDNNTIVPFAVNGQEQTRFKIVFQNTSLSTPDFNNEIVLYPNPGKAGGSFYLQNITEATVTLYNLLGKNIPVLTTAKEHGIQVTPSGSLSQGVYLINVTSQGKTTQVKWIVE